MGGRDVVTGAFSYTGRHIAERLLAAGRAVATLTGHPDRPDALRARIQARPLQWRDPAALAASLRGADTLYNTYWVRFARGRTDHGLAVQQSRALFAAAELAGVRRIVHVSITGADPASPLPYFQGKGQVEAALRTGRTSWAIVRPALIFGPKDVLLHNIAWLLRRLPVFPVFGDGRYPVQPVHVDDLAEQAVAMGGAEANLQADAVGPDTFTYEELVARIASAIGRPRRILHTPPGLALAGASALGRLLRDVIVTRDEVRGLMAGLLVSRQPPTGTRRLGDWLDQNAASLGTVWASELDRHYQSPPQGGA